MLFHIHIRNFCRRLSIGNGLLRFFSQHQIVRFAPSFTGTWFDAFRIPESSDDIAAKL